MINYIKNWVALDDLIEAVCHNTFIDEVIASMPEEQAQLIICNIVKEHVLEGLNKEW